MKTQKRILIIFTITVILLVMTVTALCEQTVWNCPECGRMGNTGKYCGGCGHPAPWFENNKTESISDDASVEEKRPSLIIDTGTSILRDLKADEKQAADAGDSSREILIYKGKSAKLTGKLENVQPAPKNEFTWESSDPSVATVKNGTVTGKNEGTAIITCAALLEDGTELKASVPVVVEIALASLSVKTKTYTLYTGYSSEPIELVFEPDNATCKTVSWSSADESVATVDENGVITGVKEGKTMITAVSEEMTDGKQKPKAVTVTVNVLQPAMEKAVVSWDLKGDEMLNTAFFFAGIDEPLPSQTGINDFTIRKLDNGRMEMTFTYKTNIDFVPTEEQTKKIGKAAQNGKIGGNWGYCIVDYTTGLDLEEENSLGVECTNSDWTYDDKKEFTASDGSWIWFNRNHSATVTVTWPSDYKDLCIGIFGCSTAFGSKKDEAFWKGKVPFHETDYYFKDHPEYTHFMRVSESNIF